MRPVLAALLTASLALAGCGDDTVDQANTVPTTPPPTTPETPAQTDGTTPADGAQVKDGECRDVEAPPAKEGDVSEPSGTLDTGKRHIATFVTSCGTFKVELDAEGNPKTANVIAHLAKEQFYDGTTFHRVIPEFMVQGGDPAGNGSGGPSWSVVEKPDAGTKYEVGTMAMAKTATDPDGTSGSQFFVVTGPQGEALPAQYAVAGKVVKGMNVIEAIEAEGSPSGTTERPVVITSVSYEAR